MKQEYDREQKEAFTKFIKWFDKQRETDALLEEPEEPCCTCIHGTTCQHCNSEYDKFEPEIPTEEKKDKIVTCNCEVDGVDRKAYGNVALEKSGNRDKLRDIERIAYDEAGSYDWNDLSHKKIWIEGFIKGALCQSEYIPTASYEHKITLYEQTVQQEQQRADNAERVISELVAFVEDLDMSYGGYEDILEKIKELHE